MPLQPRHSRLGSVVFVAGAFILLFVVVIIWVALPNPKTTPEVQVALDGCDDGSSSAEHSKPQTPSNRSNRTELTNDSNTVNAGNAASDLESEGNPPKGIADDKRDTTPPSAALKRLLQMGTLSQLPPLDAADFENVPARADYSGGTPSHELHLHSELNPDVLRVHVDCRIGDEDNGTSLPVELVRVQDGVSWRARTDHVGLALIQVPATDWMEEYWLRVKFGEKTYTKYLSPRRTMCGERPAIQVVESFPFKGKCIASIRIPKSSQPDIIVETCGENGAPFGGVSLWGGCTYLGETDSEGRAVVASALLDLANGGFLGAYISGWIPAFVIKGIAMGKAGSNESVRLVLSIPERVVHARCEFIPPAEEFNQKSYTKDQRFWGDLLRKPTSVAFDPHSEYGVAVAADKSSAWRLREIGGWYAGCWTHTNEGYEVVVPGNGNYVVILGRRVEEVSRAGRTITRSFPSSLLDVSVEGAIASANLVYLR